MTRSTGPTGIRHLRNALLAMASAALCSALSIGPASAGPSTGEGGRQPTHLLELFTSQGCYSCPPADELLGELIKRSDVVGLSLNIDYWSYLGWDDPLAKADYTKRQKNYAMHRRERGVYTPQLVVNGAVGVVGSQKAAVAAALKPRRAAPAAAPTIALDRQGGVVEITLTGARLSSGSAVMAAPYRSSVTTKITAGENGGKTLTYHNVALELREVGSYEGGEKTLSATLPEEADGVAVWLQETTRYGPVGTVLTAAKLDF